jgi:hypothetical protein
VPPEPASDRRWTETFLSEGGDPVSFFLGDLAVLHTLLLIRRGLRKSEVFQVTSLFAGVVALTI